MIHPSPVIALCSGEPAGIGPDICLGLATESHDIRIIVLGDPEVLAARAHALALPIRIVTRASPTDVEFQRPGVLQMLPFPAEVPVTTGVIDARNGRHVLNLLRHGAELCRRKECAALVTAPVNKSAINAAGFPFSGHTEFLAELTGARQPVMLLVGGTMRVALATTHLPLRAVPDAIDGALLESVTRVLATDLERLFGIDPPRIVVLGLNPHAGESGVLGTEEMLIIAPALERLRAQGIDVRGPVPADTAFTPEALEDCDAVLAMYHDQGLPVIKTAAFGEVVNVTLGLPIIRTSVDHGTALALAGTGRARHDSLRAAVTLANRLAQRERA
jgi:4-hydroxythreonine-4-phosphate dehydrogenase